MWPLGTIHLCVTLPCFERMKLVVRWTNSDQAKKRVRHYQDIPLVPHTPPSESSDRGMSGIRKHIAQITSHGTMHKTNLGTLICLLLQRTKMEVPKKIGMRMYFAWIKTRYQLHIHRYCTPSCPSGPPSQGQERGGQRNISLAGWKEVSRETLGIHALPSCRLLCLCLKNGGAERRSSWGTLCGNWIRKWDLPPIDALSLPLSFASSL